MVLFERIEFLIHTPQKKICTVCTAINVCTWSVCSTNLGFSVEQKICAAIKVCTYLTNLGFSVEQKNLYGNKSLHGNKNCLGFSVGFVLCTGYVCTWYQRA